MIDKEKKLQVKDITISFKTINGKLQAVRDISFDLYKGETLAIVGESGSGKSATSKTILGISAGNTIVESGEILYDGKDLLKISEDDYHQIRGDKISMVFQDPLSSLNPIMRIGNQITEAMLLKNKAARRENRVKFNLLTKKLAASQAKLGIAGTSAEFAKLKKIIAVQVKYEVPYEQAVSNATAGLKAIEDMELGIEKNAITDPHADSKELALYLNASADRYVVDDKAAIKSIASELTSACRKSAVKKNGYDNVHGILARAKTMLEEALKKEKPDFFAIGCKTVLESDEATNQFIKSLLDNTRTALEESSEESVKDMAVACNTLTEAAKLFEGEMPQKESDAVKLVKELSDCVEKAIDPFETVKESSAYIFRASILHAIKTYYADSRANVAEKKRFEKQTARFNRLKARGKDIGYTVVPLSLSDTDLVKSNIVKILNDMVAQFKSREEVVKQFNFNNRSEAFIDFLKKTAINSISVVTKSMAKDRAIRVMEQVGITEARKRYRQYPFEFSGGMRQRIVIAIALTANPDILICDEPTTALDVTIQAQILELINKLKEERNLSVIFITHDLGVVANMADRIAVMYAGKIVEYGTSREVFYSPAHPYTWALLASIPDLNSKGSRLESIPGTPPNMIYPPKGDAFAARNKYAMEIDFEEQPPMFKITDTHYAATWLLHPKAPKVEMPQIIKDRIARMQQGGQNNE